MGLVDRLIIAVYTIVLTGLSALLVLVALGWSDPLTLLQEVFMDVRGRWAAGFIGALFFIIGLRLLTSLLRRRVVNGALVRQAKLGEVQVALGAVEHFVARVGRQVDGVRDLRARVTPGEEGIRVHLRASVAANVHVPDLSEQLQTAVQQQVQETIGVGVEHIHTIIDSIDGDARRRVE